MDAKYQQNVQKNNDLEETIASLNNRIKELNNEKNDFLQLASHELKSPLRKIATFSDMLENKFASEIPADALTYLERIKKNITSMQSIIDAVTKLTTITGNDSSETCDLNNPLAEAIQQLSGFITETQANVRVCELPVVKANCNNMKTVFYNLLNNSIKFRRQGETPQIQVSCFEVTGEEKNNFNLSFENIYYKIKFADNGIGFDQEYAEKIFEPFVQLNGKSEVSGTGLGLSICRKILELHDGIIYAKSNNAGSSFTLILPKLANNAHAGEN
jgi:signal transduction histidine kinase